MNENEVVVLPTLEPQYIEPEPVLPAPSSSSSFSARTSNVVSAVEPPAKDVPLAPVIRIDPVPAPSVAPAAPVAAVPRRRFRPATQRRRQQQRTQQQQQQPNNVVETVVRRVQQQQQQQLPVTNSYRCVDV